jgi:hypothetical protein
MNVRVRGTSIALRGAALAASLLMPAGCVFFGNEEPNWTGSWQEPAVTITVENIAVELVQSGEEIVAHVTWEWAADETLPAEAPPPTFTGFAASQDNVELIRAAIQGPEMSVSVTVNTHIVYMVGEVAVAESWCPWVNRTCRHPRARISLEGYLPPEPYWVHRAAVDYGYSPEFVVVDLDGDGLEDIVANPGNLFALSPFDDRVIWRTLMGNQSALVAGDFEPTDPRPDIAAIRWTEDAQQVMVYRGVDGEKIASAPMDGCVGNPTLQTIPATDATGDDLLLTCTDWLRRYDGATGALEWEITRDDAMWDGGAVVPIGGRVINVTTRGGDLVGMDLADGAEIWRRSDIQPNPPSGGGSPHYGWQVVAYGRCDVPLAFVTDTGRAFAVKVETGGTVWTVGDLNEDLTIQSIRWRNLYLSDSFRSWYGARISLCDGEVIDTYAPWLPSDPQRHFMAGLLATDDSGDRRIQFRFNPAENRISIYPAQSAFPSAVALRGPDEQWMLAVPYDKELRVYATKYGIPTPVEGALADSWRQVGYDAGRSMYVP